MAAYEVLLLNTAIPQIQAAQSGDTYVVPRDIAINATAIISANSATDALRITQTGAGNAILVEDSANPDSTPFVVTAAGDVGIGTSSPGRKLDISGNSRITGGNGIFFEWNNGTDATYVSQEVNAEFRINQSTVSANSKITFLTQGTLKATLDSSGNLGLGVTPSAWGGFGVKAFEVSTGASFSGSGSDAGMIANAYYNGSNWIYKISSLAVRYQQIIGTGAHAWYTAGAGTAGNPISFTQAMTLDASGRLLIGGTSSPSSSNIRLLAQSPNASSDGGAQFAYNGGGGGGGAIFSATGSGLVFFGYTGVVGSETYTERARITSGGYFKASNTGSYLGSTAAYHELRTDGAVGDWTTTFTNTTATGANAYGLFVKYTASSPNGTGNEFLVLEDSSALRAEFRSNGGLANYQSNNVDLSDIRTKTDINPLASYWSKIAALEIVSYKYKDQTHDDLNIGVIAQQVEQVAPEFVDADGFGETPEDGVPLKTIYNKDLTFAAIKALQEAMARIETLEAEVAALKGA